MRCLVGDGGGCFPSHGKMLWLAREAGLAESVEQQHQVPPPPSVLPEHDLPGIILGKGEGKRI